MSDFFPRSSYELTLVRAHTGSPSTLRVIPSATTLFTCSPASRSSSPQVATHVFYVPFWLQEVLRNCALKGRVLLNCPQRCLIFRLSQLLKERHESRNGPAFAEARRRGLGQLLKPLAASSMRCVQESLLVIEKSLTGPCESCVPFMVLSLTGFCDLKVVA